MGTALMLSPSREVITYKEPLIYVLYGDLGPEPYVVYPALGTFCLPLLGDEYKRLVGRELPTYDREERGEGRSRRRPGMERSRRERQWQYIDTLIQDLRQSPRE